MNKLPFIDRVPLVRSFVVGRVEMARREGAAQERITWERQVEDLKEQAQALKNQKAADIAEIERKHLHERIENSIAIGRLQEVIDDLETHPSSDNRPRPPAVSKRLSVALDAVGRSPGNQP